MPLSMTGYGSATVEQDGVGVSVELRSVNHRHLDAKFRPTIGLPALEAKLVGELRKVVTRGHVDIRVTATAAAATAALRVDVARADAYQKAADEIRKELGVQGELSLHDLMKMPGVIESAASHSLLAEREEHVVQVFRSAVGDFTQTRATEGVRLAADLSDRIATLRRLRAEIATFADDQFSQRHEQLKTRLQEALDQIGATVDMGRLEQEMVHIADRRDITEELVRFAAHLDSFEQTLASGEPVGKKLGFLGQEILREINTVGSKSQLIEITERVVSAKVEIEKCREQLLNLE